MSEESKKILLNKKKSKVSTNEDTLLELSIDSTEKKLPVDKVEDTINEYAQYVREKDASNKYRFVFTINPICSNVLFNRISEITINEGSSACTFFSNDGKIGSYNKENSAYKSLKQWNDKSDLNRRNLIRDTSISHSEIAGTNNIDYHCGYDIFNNHYFRNLETVLINKAVKEKSIFDTEQHKYIDETGGELTPNRINRRSGTEGVNYIREFNEIGDYARDFNGNLILSVNGVDRKETPTHVFFVNTTRSYRESIVHNLTERDGWFGFNNPSKFEIQNLEIRVPNSLHMLNHIADYSVEESFTINKALNNRKSCEFVDMYPGRDLYSFMPKVNKFRNRNEYNWDYCITYPYDNYYKNTLVSLLDEKGKVLVNGLKAEFSDEYGILINDINKLLNNTGSSVYTVDDKEYQDVYIRTHTKNNINSGDNVIIHLVADIVYGETNEVFYKTINEPINVKLAGLNTYNGEHYFTIALSDIASGLYSVINENVGKDIANIYCYVQRIDSGRPCKYYFRRFKRLPNFKNTNVNAINGISEEDIEKYRLTTFSSSLNRLGFGKNIYGDQMAQIVFNDDVDTTNIHDNLGRPITELYLTIIKTNRGNKNWYADDGEGSLKGITNFTNDSVEFSHCFSDVISGVDLPFYSFDNNVHSLHGLPLVSAVEEGDVYDTNEHAVKNTILLYPESSTPLEKAITISGTTLVNNDKGRRKNNAEFLGDICELSENTLTEVILDDVCHRFNTKQRECVTLVNEFGTLYFDELVSDDFDSEFKVDKDMKFYENVGDGGTAYLDNVEPEGYYYKPHHGIQVREFDDEVLEGYHTKIVFDNIIAEMKGDDTVMGGRTDRNYYLEVGKTVYIYLKTTGEQIEAEITRVSTSAADEYRTVSFRVKKHDITYEVNSGLTTFFKPNILMPANAYELNDGTGKYVWRTLKSETNIGSDDPLYDSVFTNGAHYFHKNINFFLRRQDPYGYFGLNSLLNDRVPAEYQIFDVSGTEKDLTVASYIKEGENILC